MIWACLFALQEPSRDIRFFLEFLKPNDGFRFTSVSSFSIKETENFINKKFEELEKNYIANIIKISSSSKFLVTCIQKER